MKLNKLAFLCTLTFSTLSLSAHADLLITNNTGSYGTGRVASSPCSSEAGDQGIVKPHSRLNVPQAAFDFYCGLLPCEAHIFASQNCSGKQIAVMKIEFNRGVTHINNLDPEHYIVSGGGNSIEVNPGKGFLERWFKWF